MPSSPPHAAPDPSHTPAPPSAPSWLRPLLIFMGACAPGGFLFLIALLTGSNIDLEKPVWFILAVAGGLAGHVAGRRAGG